MRYFEIKPSVLLEFDSSALSAQKAIADLTGIEQAAKSLPPEAKPDIQKITASFNATKTKVDGLLSKLKTQLPVNTPQSQLPVEEPEEVSEADLTGKQIGGDVEYDALKRTIQQAKNEIATIQQMPIAKKYKDQLISTWQTTIKQATALLNKYVDVVDELKLETQKRIAAENFVTDLNSVLITLGNKVQGYVAVSPDQYKALSIRDKKIHDNAANFTATFTNALFGMVFSLINKNKEVDKLAIQHFLEACVRGDVLNMLGLTSVDSGNVRDHVKDEYKPMIELFQTHKIFSWSPGKTSGAIGPGEMALSMMGSPTEKAKSKGDLDVGGTMYEIKAGANNGGRLNSDAILKGPSAWPTWAAGIEKIVKKRAPANVTWVRRDKKGNEYKVNKTNYTANSWNPTPKGSKEGAVYNFSERSLNRLNAEVLQYSTPQLTYELFNNTFQALIKNLKEVQKSSETSRGVSAEKIIWSAIYDDGTIDVDKMMKAYTRLAYESYNRANGVESILFLNTNSLDYTITRNGVDLISKLNNGDLKITSGFNFNDSQQSATPGYLPPKKTTK
jgi:hypothetical protein